jgi:uncharacterized damage-inducible protein DinB
MPKILVSRALDAFAASRKIIAGMLDGVPAEQFCHQPYPGANHALWTMGHLATVDQYFLKKLDARPETRFDEFRKMFFMKSTPQPSLSDYPPVPEVRAYFDQSRLELLDWLRSLDDDQLERPLPEPFHSFQPNLTLLFGHLSWHEGFHAGQLSVIRKSLGVTPMFG